MTKIPKLTACETCGWLFHPDQFVEAKKRDMKLMYECEKCRRTVCTNYRNRARYSQHTRCPDII